jgi:hypothetical protein
MGSTQTVGLLNSWHELAAGARVIRNSDISVLPASGTHQSLRFCFITF